MNKYPQTLLNVEVAKKIDIGQSVPIQSALKDAESMLADRGRVLLRPSGTEPLIRVMVEGQDATQVHQVAQQLAEVVRAAMT